MEIGVAHLTALELDPAQFAAQAAEIGYRAIGLRVNPAMAGGLAYPLKVGTDAHRNLKAILAGEGVRLNDIEFIPMAPDFHASAHEVMLHNGAELGARSVNVAGDDPDEARFAAHLNELCGLAARYGLRIDLEFMRWRHANSFETALRVANMVTEPNFGILVDTLHLFRSGGSELDFQRPGASAYVRHIQLSDTAIPTIRTDEEAMAEARGQRSALGEGVLPLERLRPHLPSHAVFSVEFPNETIPLHQRLMSGFQTARDYLANRRSA